MIGCDTSLGILVFKHSIHDLVFKNDVLHRKHDYCSGESFVQLYQLFIGHEEDGEREFLVCNIHI